MGFTDDLQAIENSLLQAFEKNALDKLDVDITKAGPGRYYIKVTLPVVGDQNFLLRFDANNNFYFSGPVAIIGPNASFPVSLLANMINSYVQAWIGSLINPPTNAAPKVISSDVNEANTESK